jgi:YidC/Oxa1 family membrane protein insertase
MVGWFSLNVPSGLTLYYFCNTLFTGAIQIYLKKLGGAAAAEFDLGPIELGRARRSGVAALATASANGETEAAGPSEAGGEAAAAAAAFSAGGAAAGGAAAAAEAEAEVEAAAAAPPSRRCKRLRRELLEA